MKNDRRKFLKNLSGVAAAALAGTRLSNPALGQVPPAGAASVSAADPPASGRVHVGLFLDNAQGVETFAGWLDSAGGGGLQGEVVSEKVGPDHIIHKHLAGVRYEDITVTCGTGMSPAFYEWIQSSFAHQAAPQSGLITVANSDHLVLSTLQFENALLSEVGFPALDASSKDAAKMTLKFSPERSVFRLGQGEKITAPPRSRQKRWLASNFKIEIDGLDAATSGVQQIDALSVKLLVQSDSATATGGIPAVALIQDISAIGATLPEAMSSGFDQWNQDLLSNNNANNPDAAERNGVLQFLSNDRQEVFFVLSFRNLGAFAATALKVESGSENIRRVKAEMYVEEIQFEFKSAAWA